MDNFSKELMQYDRMIRRMESFAGIQILEQKAKTGCWFKLVDRLKGCVKNGKVDPHLVSQEFAEFADDDEYSPEEFSRLVVECATEIIADAFLVSRKHAREAMQGLLLPSDSPHRPIEKW